MVCEDKTCLWKIVVGGIVLMLLTTMIIGAVNLDEVQYEILDSAGKEQRFNAYNIWGEIDLNNMSEGSLVDEHYGDALGDITDFNEAENAYIEEAVNAAKEANGGEVDPEGPTEDEIRETAEEKFMDEHYTRWHEQYSAAIKAQRPALEAAGSGWLAMFWCGGIFGAIAWMVFCCIKPDDNTPSKNSGAIELPDPSAEFNAVTDIGPGGNQRPRLARAMTIRRRLGGLPAHATPDLTLWQAAPILVTVPLLSSFLAHRCIRMYYRARKPVVRRIPSRRPSDVLLGFTAP